VVQDLQQPFVKQATPATGQDDRIPGQRSSGDALVGVRNAIEQLAGGFFDLILARILPPTSLKEISGDGATYSVGW